LFSWLTSKSLVPITLFSRCPLYLYHFIIVYEKELMKIKDAYIGIEGFLAHKKLVWKNE
jgi:hypothetical protein